MKLFNPKYIFVFTNIKAKEYDEPTPAKVAKIASHMSADIIRKSCLQMVSIHGRPLSIFQDKAMKNLLKPIIAAFPENERFTLNPQPSFYR